MKKFKLEIMHDEDAANPRKEYENLGEMICFHRNYDLGDKHEFTAPERAKAWIDQHAAVCLPLYLYDHSGITMSTSPFSCPWDSGQVGWIWVSKEKARKEFNVKRISPKLKAKLAEILRQEVTTYDQYLTGDVYGFTLYEVLEVNTGDGAELQTRELDSCWGFYGSDPATNGMVDYLPCSLDDCEVINI